jgi:hypothetical protein
MLISFFEGFLGAGIKCILEKLARIPSRMAFGEYRIISKVCLLGFGYVTTPGSNATAVDPKVYFKRFTIFTPDGKKGTPFLLKRYTL